MSRALEILWLCIGAFTFGLGINQSVKFGIKESYQLFIISLIAFSLFLLRLNLRKKNKNN